MSEAGSEKSFDEEEANAEDMAGVQTQQKLPESIKDGKHKINSSWIFKGLPVKYENGEKVRTIHRESTSQLHVSKVELSDAGLYRVRVRNEHGSVERSINVDFTPTLVKDINLKEVTVRSGGMDTFRLEVEMSGGEVT